MEFTSRLTAVLLAIILLPLLVIIASISLIIQGFPIIFIQPRVGKNFKNLISINLGQSKVKAGILLFLIVAISYKFLNGGSFFENQIR